MKQLRNSNPGFFVEKLGKKHKLEMKQDWRKTWLFSYIC